MKKIRVELQEMEDEQMDGYQLKTNQDIIDQIAEFGNGKTEFHTIDINRLVVENERVKREFETLEASKTQHELPNDNTYEYNYGYVKAMNTALNRLKAIF